MTANVPLLVLDDKLLTSTHSIDFEVLQAYVSLSEAKLCGADIASVDVNTLDILHITTPDDREQLLSAIYNELHPPNTLTQRLDSLLGTFDA